MVARSSELEAHAKSARQKLINIHLVYIVRNLYYNTKKN